MNVPRLNADEERGFLLATNAMALEGAIMKSSAWAGQDDSHAPRLSPTEAYQNAGQHVIDMAQLLEQVLDP